MWLDRAQYVERVQIALDSLESEKLSVVIVCVAEELPVDNLHFSGPVVLPFSHLKSVVESGIRFRQGANAAVFSYGRRQREQQQVAWSRESWVRHTNFSYFELDEGWEVAGAEAEEVDADFGLIMGYGAGLLGKRDSLAELRGQFHSPVLVGFDPVW